MNSSIAIIGMSCQASGISNLEEYWQVISEGKSTLRRYSKEELSESGIGKSQLASNDYVPIGGHINGADEFDAGFFGIPPKEALYMDPQHRKFLEEAYHAFEHAGILPESYEGLAGVFAGCSQNNYRLRNIEKTSAGSDWSEFQKQIASDKDFLATQVAYKLGLRGPALTIQTACSTSLVAVDAACKYLDSNQCDIAVAGGVHINVPLKQGYLAMEGGILSPTGECRAFDKSADGTVFSSGVGVVILKRLDNAIKANDTIYGVIESIATNNDGNKKVSYTAPGYNGQAEVIAMAQAMAGVDPAEISYVEAHGTGTKLGDPLEIQALTSAFRLETNSNQYCVLGSVKPNIGHCDVAAGVMGLIKVCLCLTHRVYPPQVNFDQINPEIDLENSPFVINKIRKPWPNGTNGKRVAAVSSFGVGGTNAHAILSEPPQRRAAQSSRVNVPLIIPISGKSSDSALENAHRLGKFLENNNTDIVDVARTMTLHRTAFNYRTFIVASSSNEASEKLLAVDDRKLARKVHEKCPVIFMFPGQGSQHVNMAKDLYEKETVFRDSMDQCFGVLNDILEYDLKQVLYPNQEDFESASELLKHTEVAQPALFSISYSVAQLLDSWGIKPDKMIGHSIGEYVAACLSGVFSLKDALKIVAKRGQLMQSMNTGSMLAVIADEKTVKSELPTNLSVAAINSPSITVVSGESQAVHAFEEKLNDLSIRAVPLHTSHAFHSYMMDPMLEPFTNSFKSVELKAPKIPFCSCVSGQLITPQQSQSPQYWAQQVRKPVMFSQGILNLLDNANAICLEVGPSNALTNALSAHDLENEVIFYNTLPAAASSENSLVQFNSIIGNLWANSNCIDSHDLAGRLSGCSIPLPGYAFQSDKYWLNYNAEHLSLASTLPGVSASVKKQESENKLAVQSPTREKLKSLLTELSGVEFDESNYQTDFISLGFESLLAAEIRTSLKSKLGVVLDIPQLLSRFNSFDKLLSFCVSEAKEVPDNSISTNEMDLEDYLQEPSTLAENVSLIDLYQAIQEQTRLIRQLVDQSAGNEIQNPSQDKPVAMDLPDYAAAEFQQRPTPEARLGKDPEGQPHWYVPDPERPGKYRLFSQ